MERQQLRCRTAKFGRSFVAAHLEYRVLIVHSRSQAFTALLELFGSQITGKPADEDPEAGITSIDYEEQTAGYQVAYSKLAASETARPDPVAYAADTKQYLLKEVAEAVQRTGGSTWTSLIQRCPPEVAGAFVQEYQAAGYSF